LSIKIEVRKGTADCAISEKGINIDGGSGIKGQAGQRAERRLDRGTAPDCHAASSQPPAVAAVVDELVRHFNYSGPIGVTFPAIVHISVLSAANVDPSFKWRQLKRIFEQAGRRCPRAQRRRRRRGGRDDLQGAGREFTQGIAILLTFGTGIGSAIFHDGKLLPNTEFGHVPLPMKGIHAEHYCSDRVRKLQNLDGRSGPSRVDPVPLALMKYFSPDVFIIGGGVSQKFDKFAPRLRRPVRCRPS
jgi:polyphosphate glucokinase